jgi:hypothetical protein
MEGVRRRSALMQNAGMQRFSISLTATFSINAESAFHSGENRNSVIPEGYMDESSNPDVPSCSLLYKLSIETERIKKIMRKGVFSFYFFYKIKALGPSFSGNISETGW